MKKITFRLAQGKIESSEVHTADNLSVQLVFDYKGTGYEAWTKYVDLRMSDGTSDIQNLGTGEEVTFDLTSAHTKAGNLYINPYCMDGTARKGFPISKVEIGRQLSNGAVTATVQTYINDYIDSRLTVKAVTAQTLEAGQPAEATVTQEADGVTYAFGIPIPDISAIESAEATRLASEATRVSNEQSRVTAEGSRVTAEGNRVTAEQGRATAEGNRVTAESGRVSAESARVTAENARNVFQAYNGATAYVVGNKVSYNGSSYVCILNSTGNLPTNGTYWQIVAQKGTDGEVTNASLATTLGNYALKAQEAWITPSLLNGATSDATDPIRYRKTSTGRVVFKGRGTFGAGQAISMPVGYQVAAGKNFRVPVVAASGLTMGVFVIVSGNAVFVSTGTFSLDNVSYEAEG